MKVVFPKDNTTKTIKVPNGLILNRFLFGILKITLRIITKSPAIFRIKYKHIKPIVKKVNEYKDFEIVSVESRHGGTVKVFL